MLFCLLGGHSVSYELAASAAETLVRRGVFGGCERREARLERWLRDLLSRPWYEPRRLDGSGRRYRYPKRKAALLRQADDWLRVCAPHGLLSTLAEIEDERGRRRWLCDCPGAGPKTASWVLRNVGLGNDLAIIDIHIMRALQDTGRAANARLPRDYDLLEQEFLRWSADLGASPAVFDLFLWEYGRGDV